MERLSYLIMSEFIVICGCGLISEGSNIKLALGVFLICNAIIPLVIGLCFRIIDCIEKKEK